MKTVLVAAVAWLVLLAGCTVEPDGPVGAPGPDDAPPPRGCPGHWHATMKVFVNGDEVDFSSFDLGATDPAYRTPIEHHLHQQDTRKYQWHFEPPGAAACTGFRKPAANVDVKVSADTLVLDGVHEGTPWGGTWTATATHAVQVRHDPGDGWRPLSAAGLASRQLADGEKILILYGAYTDADIEAMQAAVPDPVTGR